MLMMLMLCSERVFSDLRHTIDKLGDSGSEWDMKLIIRRWREFDPGVCVCVCGGVHLCGEVLCVVLAFVYVKI